MLSLKISETSLFFSYFSIKGTTKKTLLMAKPKQFKNPYLSSYMHIFILLIIRIIAQGQFLNIMGIYHRFKVYLKPRDHSYILASLSKHVI